MATEVSDNDRMVHSSKGLGVLRVPCCFDVANYGAHRVGASDRFLIRQHSTGPHSRSFPTCSPTNLGVSSLFHSSPSIDLEPNGSSVNWISAKVVAEIPREQGGLLRHLQDPVPLVKFHHSSTFLCACLEHVR